MLPFLLPSGRCFFPLPPWGFWKPCEVLQSFIQIMLLASSSFRRSCRALLFSDRCCLLSPLEVVLLSPFLLWVAMLAPHQRRMGEIQHLQHEEGMKAAPPAGRREYSSTTPDKCEEGSTIPKEGITHKERGNAQSPYMRRSSAQQGKWSGTHHQGGGRTEALPTSNRQPRVYEIDIFKSMREHERNKTHQCLIFAHMFSKIFLSQENFVEWPEGQLFREGW